MAIETGDRLAFELEGDGRVRVSRVRNELRPLRGLLSKYAKSEPVADEKVRTALGRRAEAKYAARAGEHGEGRKYRQTPTSGAAK